MEFGVWETLSHWARYTPDAPAVTSGPDVLSYRSLHARSDLFRAAVVNCPFPRIGLALRRKADYLAAVAGVLGARKSAVFVNLALGDAELGVNCRDVKLQALLHDDQHTSLAAQLVGDNPWTLNCSNLSPQPPLQQPMSPEPQLGQPGDEFGVFFSSGSTGIPKGIERDHYSMMVEHVGWCLELGLRRAHSFYIGRPVYYTGGLVLALSTLLVGGSLIVNDYLDDDDWDAVWRDYQAVLASRSITYAFFLPDQVRHFLSLAANRPSEVRSAECILLMGAPVAPAEKIAAADRFGCAVVESWGNSEALGTITDRADLERRPASIGRPFLGDALHVVRDDLTVADARELGRLAGAEAAGFAQYSGRPVDTGAVKRSGLIVSDDLGWTDEDGYFYLEGRDQERILTAAGTVFLRPIEAALRDHPALEDACVVGVRGGDGLIELVAAVVLVQNSSVIPDLASLNAGLDMPSRIARLVVVQGLPRVGAGKVDRAAVAQMCQDA